LTDRQYESLVYTGMLLLLFTKQRQLSSPSVNREPGPRQFWQQTGCSCVMLLWSIFNNNLKTYS